MRARSRPRILVNRPPCAHCTSLGLSIPLATLGRSPGVRPCPAARPHAAFPAAPRPGWRSHGTAEDSRRACCRCKLRPVSGAGRPDSSRSPETQDDQPARSQYHHRQHTGRCRRSDHSGERSHPQRQRPLPAEDRQLGERSCRLRRMRPLLADCAHAQLPDYGHPWPHTSARTKCGRSSGVSAAHRPPWRTQRERGGWARTHDRRIMSPRASRSLRFRAVLTWENELTSYHPDPGELQPELQPGAGSCRPRYPEARIRPEHWRWLVPARSFWAQRYMSQRPTGTPQLRGSAHLRGEAAHWQTWRVVRYRCRTTCSTITW